MDQNTVSAIADLAVATATASSVNGSAPFVTVPQGYKVEDLERLQAAPSRKRGLFALRDVESFIAFVGRHANENTTLYGIKSPPSFKAVFDDHGVVDPGWREHVASYTCPLSVEWMTWTNSNKRVMTQEAFAQFIEDNAPDCVTPDSATMIEISRTLEAKKKVNFASGIRLANGQTELTYEEEISGTAGKGKFTVPETFVIGIPVMEGGARYSITARLRYRIAEKGALTMWFDLERAHKVIEHAADEVWQHIKAETRMPIFNGA